MLQVILLIALSATAFVQNTGDEAEAIRSVLAEVNHLELELYKAPNDEALMKKFLELVQVGGQKETDVRERVERARGRNAHVMAESAKHVVAVTKTEVRGDTATVYTRETSHWVWTHGPVFDQVDRTHIYHLRKFRTGWKVVSEQF